MEISILVHFPVSLLGIYKKKKAIPTENKFKLFLESKCIEVNLTEATCAALFFFNQYIEKWIVITHYNSGKKKASLAALCFGFVQFNDSQVWIPVELWEKSFRLGS